MDERTADDAVYYPVFLDLRGKHCVVVGGGEVAVRKVEGLLAAGAVVTVVAPDVQPMPAGVTIKQRGFVVDDLDGAWLTIAATDIREVNAEVFAAAEARHLFVNVVDVPTQCSLILPAVVRRGAFCLAISTGGGSPVLARRLRERLEAEFGDEYGALVDLLHRLRQRWDPRAKAAGFPFPRRKQVWEQVLDLPLLDYLRAGDVAGAEAAAWAVLEVALS